MLLCPGVSLAGTAFLPSGLLRCPPVVAGAPKSGLTGSEYPEPGRKC